MIKAVSFLLVNLKRPTFDETLALICKTPELSEAELVIVDNASTDGRWEIALEYQARFPERITLSRNRKQRNKSFNTQKAIKLAKAHRTFLIPNEFKVDQSAPKILLETLTSKPHAFETNLNFVVNNPNIPLTSLPKTNRNTENLVSVCIYNYNYGKYLSNCIESVLEQTHKNIEICFSDNASTDDSWHTVLKYATQHPEKFNLTRTRVNVGATNNLFNAMMDARGNYLIQLCSDDMIKPSMLKTCVKYLRAYPNAAFCMTHRDILFDDKIETEPPFYAHACLIPGEAQNAVYMMSSVNPSISQIVYKTSHLFPKTQAGNLNYRWLGNRLTDFDICCTAPIIYLPDALLINRVHSKSDSQNMSDTLLQCISEYILVHQISDKARHFQNMTEVVNRLPKAIEKLSQLCLRYALRSIHANQLATAERYFHQAKVFDLSIQQDEHYSIFENFFKAPNKEARDFQYSKLKELENLKSRKISYPPPAGAIPLQEH